MAGKEPTITFTDEGCMIGGLPRPSIPLLIDYNYQILEAPSDWLRHLIVTRRQSAESVRQFAYHLKNWWGFINRTGVAWDGVDDFVMRDWRDLLLEKNDAATVNGRVSTVFRMYIWAERNGHTEGVIGEVDFGRNFRPPLTVDVRTRRNGTRSYSSPLLIKTTAKPTLATPTNDEITKIHAALAEMYGDNTDLLVRDALILTWAEETGTRRAETLSLKVSDIPEWDEILDLEEKGETKDISIVGKGRKRRSIWARPELLAQTRDYIEGEREALVGRLRARLGSSYRIPKEVFLSSKTGHRLHNDTVSQNFAKAFRKAGVKGSGHRVRARFITNLAEASFEAAYEKLGSVPDLVSVLIPIAELAGHTNVETLKPYFAIVRRRLLIQTMAERRAAAETKAVAAERRAEAGLHRLKGAGMLSELARAVESGNKKKILTALRSLTEFYSR
jgi:integrase